MIPPTKFGLDCSSWKWAWFLAVREVACLYHKEGHRVVHLNVFRFRFSQFCAMLCPKRNQNTNNFTRGLFPHEVFMENGIGEVVSWALGKLHSAHSAQLPWEALIASLSFQSSRKKAFPHNLKKLYRCSYMVFPLLSYFLGETTFLLLLLLSRFSRVRLCATP